MSAIVDGKTKKSRGKTDKFDKLIGPTDPKIDAQARDALIIARVGLLIRN